tara:strand:+ start:679 stop:876 length:198 start_codon:yes stop_codon:yes gene_type:complete
MYKPVTTDDIFSAADGNREKTVMQSNAMSAPLVNSQTTPQKPQAQMSDAEAIRAMGDRLSKIWED